MVRGGAGRRGHDLGVTTPQRIEIVAGTTGLVLAVGDDGRLHQLGFGPAATLHPSGFPVGLHPLAYPTHGEEPLREPALRITHGDGVTSTRLRVRDVTSAPADDGPGSVYRIELVDRVAPTVVTLGYRTWPDHDLIEQWVEIVNDGPDPIVVHRAAATAVALAGPAPHLTHWGGGWAGEWHETTEPLTPGTKTVASAGGVRSSLYRPPVVLIAPDGPAAETGGTVAACTVVWGGDVRFDAEVFLHGQQRLLAGHQHRGAERTLAAGERFVTPHALWTWSATGVGATSRALHRFVRDRVTRDGARTRATVANTWEAVGFALDPAGLTAQVDRAAALGAELFLLDDGWFGVEHPRDDDTQGLGDWAVDRVKLPDGLGPIIDHTVARGLRFGLWVEPEMVNPRSTRYRDHPDWVIAEPGRDRREERQQLVLDLTRPDVQAFCADVISDVLADHPGITYLKWDANRDVTEPGSTALDPDRQSHLVVDRVHATWAVMAEVARRHPEVELMLCASGGGRSDLGTLAWFHELWTSDNTDPVDRVRIQWGASHLLPASVLGAHVTRWGQRPIAFGCAVAMSGRFGVDLDLTALDDDEWATCRQAVDDYHELRDLVQRGELHRLVSPVDADRAALAFVDATGERAVVFAYVLPPTEDQARGRSDTWIAEPIELPAPPTGRSWTAVDRTPGRDRSRPAEVFDGRLLWPDDPLEARVVELRAE